MIIYILESFVSAMCDDCMGVIQHCIITNANRKCKIIAFRNLLDYIKEKREKGDLD